MNVYIFLFLAFLAPIPVFHILLHVFLRTWRRHPRATYLMGVGAWLCGIAVAWWASAIDTTIFVPPSWLATLGVSTVVLAFVLPAWSLATIGPRRFFVWAVVQLKTTKQKYIPSGPFRYMKHPAYLGYVVMALAGFVATGSLALYIHLLYFGIATTVMIRLENHELQKRLLAK